MTDAAQAGSVADANLSAGNPGNTQQQAPVDGSTASAAASPFAGLQDAGNREWVEKKGTKTFDEVVKNYRELETKLGTSLTLPAEGATKEDLDKFYSKLGRPEKPEAYEFKRPEGLPADLPYDEALAGNFKKWAHGAGLNGQQAQTLHDQFALAQAEQAKAHVTGLTKAVETTADALVKEWGPQDSEGFKIKHEMANRAIKKLGLVESFQKSGIILKDNALTDPTLALAFAQIGEKMFAEDSIDGDAAQGGDNPFKDETFNLTKASALSKSDPARARTLIKQAGKDPAHYGLK